jgi:GDP-4-dehydro-6-deoxy-D-mannose reductase
VVRAYRLLAARGEAGLWNVCSGVARSARELVAALGKAAGVTVEHIVDPARVRAHEVNEVRGDNARLRADTGWAPEIPLERTLADAVADWRERLYR